MATNGYEWNEPVPSDRGLQARFAEPFCETELISDAAVDFAWSGHRTLADNDRASYSENDFTRGVSHMFTSMDGDRSGSLGISQSQMTLIQELGLTVGDFSFVLRRGHNVVYDLDTGIQPRMNPDGKQTRDRIAPFAVAARETSPLGESLGWALLLREMDAEPSEVAGYICTIRRLGLRFDDVANYHKRGVRTVPTLLSIIRNDVDVELLISMQNIG